MTDRELLHAFADGELTPEETARVGSGLTEEEERFVRSVRDYRKEIVIRVDEPDVSSWLAARERVREIDSARRVETFVGRYAWGLVGALGLSLVFVGVRNRAIDPGRIESADLARMAASLGSSRPRPTVGAEAEKAWMDELLGRAAVSIDPQRLAIRSSAEGLLDGQRVTRLVLADAVGDLSLLVVHGPATFDGMADLGGGFGAGRIGATNCVTWSDGASAMVLCADRPVADLRAVAQRILRR